VGERGYCSSSRGNRYGIGGTAQEIFAAANTRVLTMVQIESVTGVRNAAEICSVPGVDVVFVGMGDLSQSLGVPGQLAHPDVAAATRATLEIVRAKGKIAALQVETTTAAAIWLEAGVQLLCCGVDLNLFGRTLARVRDEFQAQASPAAQVSHAD
jgi:4-hydroxy-2-oxoheptanedioate aldolase